jgi:hypothetical protein
MPLPQGLEEHYEPDELESMVIIYNEAQEEVILELWRWLRLIFSETNALKEVWGLELLDVIEQLTDQGYLDGYMEEE